ncbi:outer membrane scaffolding protein for murein synthesis (MipA/OmpV family) [Caulobacter rhizosphaerae]|uniref:Outer membrane scaffolding protein for murein synthesis (MipA/OmpV family) n=1 Tax=Caulobacter rhizosphaerae TaxID=2010972 RepID=A0ABU1MVK6_9CAUL|nr:MipA/OmpV family protein [Caulobacter rhizosphaerae]MDR6530214.1 outer membrane scaffolding protein for murein synthesis (MipA/OmpV family) [Caulobacter rhizosphaerae]
MRLLPMGAMLALLPLLASPAAAEEDKAWSGSVALGAGMRPDYMGSKDLEASPYIAGRINYGAFYLDFQGEELKLNLSPIEGLAFGPTMDVENKRDDGVKNAKVARLPQIDDALVAGGFVAYSRRAVFSPKDQLTIGASYLVDTSDTFDGALGDVSVAYGWRVNSRWSLGASAKVDLVDKKYARTYFGVTPAQAATSGLAAYDLKGGVRDVALSAKVTYALNERWNLQWLGGYKRLTGDFADSPLVKDGGSANQFSAAVAVGYRF